MSTDVAPVRSTHLVHGASERGGLGVEIAAAVARQREHGRVLACGAQDAGQLLDSTGRPAVAGHENDRARLLLRHRGGRVVTSDHQRDHADHERHQNDGRDAEHEAAPGRGEGGQHHAMVTRRPETPRYDVAL